MILKSRDKRGFIPGFSWKNDIKRLQKRAGDRFLLSPAPLLRLRIGK